MLISANKSGDTTHLISSSGELSANELDAVRLLALRSALTRFRDSAPNARTARRAETGSTQSVPRGWIERSTAAAPASDCARPRAQASTRSALPDNNRVATQTRTSKAANTA